MFLLIESEPFIISNTDSLRADDMVIFPSAPYVVTIEQVLPDGAVEYTESDLGDFRRVSMAIARGRNWEVLPEGSTIIEVLECYAADLKRGDIVARPTSGGTTRLRRVVLAGNTGVHLQDISSAEVFALRLDDDVLKVEA